MRIRVETQGSDPYNFHITSEERLLLAGLAQGVRLPYECGTGTCGQCRAILEEGTVSELWPDAPGNKYRRQERNEILMCQTRACTDCVLRVPATSLAQFTEAPPPNYFTGRVQTTEVLSPDVLGVRIELERPLKALPGQFVLLEFAEIDGPRAYSLTTSERTTNLNLLVRRKIGGLLTDWLFSPSCIEQPIKLFGPLGRSVFRKENDKDLLLIAGGTGVASTAAILRAAAKAQHFESYKANVFFGVRSPSDVFYFDELQAFAESAPRDAITINVCFSENSSQLPAPSGVNFRNGFIHEVVSEALSDVNPCETTAILSGPPPMIDATLKTLIKAKFSARQIRYDKFS
jgi:toluene monooxygenase electron transfer component